MEIYKSFSTQNIWKFTSLFRPKKYENLQVFFDPKYMEIYKSFSPKIYEIYKSFSTQNI